MVTNPVYMGLQGLALVLIFSPEPFTTIPGVWLLGYARAKMGHQECPIKRENTFAHIYDYKVQMVGESALTYELEKRRSGQMPWPQMTTRVYKLPQAWKAYQSGDRQPARPQLLNGVPLPAKKAKPASGVQMPNRVQPASRVQRPSSRDPLAELYQAQTIKKPEPVRYSKSSALMQRDQIARMLEQMRYTQSFTAANARRSST